MGTTGQSSNFFDAETRELFRKDLSKYPRLSYNDFIAQFPKWKKVPKSTFSYHVNIIRKLLNTHLDPRSPSNIPHKKGFRPLLPVWQFPYKDFEKNPLAALKSFVQALTNSHRASFELIKIELPQEESDEWIPTLEVREIQR